MAFCALTPDATSWKTLPKRYIGKYNIADKALKEIDRLKDKYRAKRAALAAIESRMAEATNAGMEIVMMHSPSWAELEPALFPGAVGDLHEVDDLGGVIGAAERADKELGGARGVPAFTDEDLLRPEPADLVGLHGHDAIERRRSGRWPERLQPA